MSELYMPIKIYIRRNSDGVIRHYDTDLNGNVKDDGSFEPFVWEEGNFACDCNRRLFFERAINSNYDDDIDNDCGSTAYSVQITDKNGTILYDEFAYKLSEGE